jgi:aminopeptidase N
MTPDVPPTWVSWQHYVDSHLNLLRADVMKAREADSREQAVRDANIASQHAEYLRRFETLNGEAAQLKKMQETYMSSDLARGELRRIEGKFEVGLSGVEQRITTLETNLGAHVAANNQALASNRALVLWMGLAIAAVEVIVRFFWG